MLDKIRIIKQRYDEVSDLIIQPEIIMDQKRYAQLSKEYKDLGGVVKRGEEYKILLNNIEEAKEIIADGSDAEMVEMAKMEIDEATTRIPELEDEIKFLKKFSNLLCFDSSMLIFEKLEIILSSLILLLLKFYYEKKLALCF